MITGNCTVGPTACVAFGPLLRARLIERENRFRVRVCLGQDRVSAHIANPGRLEELLTSGRTVWMTPASGLGRKTPYSLTLVDTGDELVSMDSHLPNLLVTQALTRGLLPSLEEFRQLQREVALGHSRLDFRLTDDDGQACWVEVKSVTLVEAGIARFPDAPTIRGRRHLQELIAAVEAGDRAEVIFIVQRSDARQFSPNAATDPSFADALRSAARAGVGVRALRCSVTRERICLQDEIPVSLDAPTATAIIPPSQWTEEQPIG